MNLKTDVKETERSASAFTLVELLTILMVLAVLCLVLLPALAGSRPANQAFQCLENQRRLVLAWRLYSDDYRGALPPNGGVGATATSMTDPNLNNGNWVHGLMGGFGFWGGETLPGLVQAGSLFPYSKDVKIYKCPADQKLALDKKTPTTRSMSMNCFLNPIGSSSGGGVDRIYRIQSDITNPAPGSLWVFLDESPGSINGPYFLCDPVANPNQWVDLPAAYHNGSGGISFADGHAEMRKWRDPRLFDALNTSTFDNVYPSNPKQNPPADLRWLQSHTTSHR